MNFSLDLRGVSSPDLDLLLLLLERDRLLLLERERLDLLEVLLERERAPLVLEPIP